MRLLAAVLFLSMMACSGLAGDALDSGFGGGGQSGDGGGDQTGLGGGDSSMGGGDALGGGDANGGGSADGGGTASTGGGTSAVGGGAGATGGGASATGGGTAATGGGSASTGGGTAATGGGAAATGGGSSAGGGLGGGIATFGDGGYGVPENGYPTYQERIAFVLTNAVRAAPVPWKTKFMSGYQNLTHVLDPAQYPVVGPLAWNYNLNRSSRYHSNEMANLGCPFQHESCDGGSPFTRINSFYGNSTGIGENIAAGYGSALNTVVGWICDAPDPNAEMTCANDHAPNDEDGHRTNIMLGSYKELGCGYQFNNNSTYRDYWTQDFGARTPYLQAAAAGSHMPYAGKTYFLLNYASASASMGAALVLAGTQTAMTMEFGSTTNGTFTVSVPVSNACRSYHFLAMDSQSRLWRFPETGELRTYGEGTCTEDWTP